MAQTPPTFSAGLGIEDASDVAAAEALVDSFGKLHQELGKVVIGQHAVIEELLIALLSRGHCLMQGVPGLAKTLLVSTVAAALDLSFRRIQFTPDLMPSDITGTDILQEDAQTGRRRFEFQHGPVFANILLADEINRTPPKTQAALLQAMQEREISAGSHTLKLPEPFFVLATQNPIEQEGTYPLPEAQLDRFMFMVLVSYPRRDDELEVLKRTTGMASPRPAKILGAQRLLEFQELVRRVPVGDPVYHFALDLVRFTRPNEPGASEFVRHWLSWGAGPRAGQHLVIAGKARALLHGRLHVTTDDIEAVASAVLRHRLIANFSAEAEGITVEQLIQKIVAMVPRPGRTNKLL